LLIWQVNGRNVDNLGVFTAGAASFALYFYPGVLVLSLLNVSLSKRVLGALVLPIGLFLLLAVLDVVIKDRGSSGGFINLQLTYKTLWLIPGLFLTAPLQHAAPISSGPEVVHIHAALPDGESIVLAGTTSDDGLRDLQLLSRLDAGGNVDASFAPLKLTLPPLAFIRPQPNGTALVSWHDYSTNKIATLRLDGTVTHLFDLTRDSELVTADPLTDVVTDTAGRLLLAGVLEKPSSDGVPGYAKVNYPLARFESNGRLDPGFALLELPKIWPGHVVRSSDGGILANYEEKGGPARLRRLLPDGRPDAVFETGLAQSLETLKHGGVHAFAFDQEGRALVVLGNGPREEYLLVRLGPDGRALANPATIPAMMGDVGGLLSHPDGSVFVTMGNEKVSSSESQLPWFPVLLHLTSDLK
jgi:hypothetical protein